MIFLAAYIDFVVHNVTKQLFAGGYVVVQEKLPNYVVPDLTDFKVLISYLFFQIIVSSCV